MRATRSKFAGGFWLSFLINLLVRTEFLVLSLLALAAHFLFGLTVWVSIVILAIWLITALFITLVLSFVTSGTYEKDTKLNKNQYSATTEDYTSKNN